MSKVTIEVTNHFVLYRFYALYLLLSFSLVSVVSYSPDPSKMRAWTCHGHNQLDLVERLCQANIVRTPAVREVMAQVDRKNFVPTNPYIDAPQAIGLGQTISAPHMHAHALEEIYPFVAKAKGPIKMLDVGCGSGYLTAALGRWVKAREVSSSETPSNPDATSESTSTNRYSILGKQGTVFAIDVHKHLVDMTTQNIKKQDDDLFTSSTISVEVGDGWKGLPQHAPFDAIHVGAAADDLPIALVNQLRVGGVLIVPVGQHGDVQDLYRVERIGDTKSSNPDDDKMGFIRDDYKISRLLAVRYVPLVHPSPES